MTNLAILSGAGALPVALSQHHTNAVCVAFNGVDHSHQSPVLDHRFEQLGVLFDDLRTRDVTEVVLAGSMSRPPLDPSVFDATTAALAPRIMVALQGGDDGLLGLVIAIFEEQGFVVRGAHDLLPELTAEAGLLAGSEPTKRELADAEFATDILMALSPLDVGQGAVAASGLCLGIETLQGTDALLEFVAQTPDHLRRAKGGVLVKTPKRGQDLRVDMPAIGPETIRRAATAGLSGIVIAAGKVVVLDRPALMAAVEESGLFLLARDL